VEQRSRRQFLLNPSAKQRAVDEPFDGRWSNESLGSQRAEERRGFPTAAGRSFLQPRAEQGTIIGPRPVGFGTRFIDENDFGRIDIALRCPPLNTLQGDVGTILLAGNQRFL